MNKTCTHCGTSFVATKNTTGKYCSSTCWYEWQKRNNDKPCPICHQTFHPKSSGQKYCGLACKHAAHRTAKRNTHCQKCGKPLSPTVNPKVRYCSKSCGMKDKVRKGQYIVPDGSTSPQSGGYVQVKHAGKWMMQHRLVMSQMLGRELEKHERVHHRNGNRADNRPENLELWKVTKKDPAGVRAADYHCHGCRCFACEVTVSKGLGI